MKPFYVVLLMGAAAIGGGLVVRYTDHPVEITFAPSSPPTVVAPPIPPTARVGPSNSVPVRAASHESPTPEAKPTQARPAVDKPSALSTPERPAKVERRPTETPIIARVMIPPEPPAVIPLERSTTPPPAPTPSPAAQPKPAPPPPEPVKPPELVKPPEPVPQPPPPETNHATLRAGMLITIRINEALSSNLNSKGDVFSGTLDRPLIADGFVIAERGAHVRGEVVESRGAGRDSELSIRLREILASDGQRVHLVSEPWRKAGIDPVTGRAKSVYDIALTRDGAAVIRPKTSITFRLDQPVELTERR
jgi:hypothetical protein